ncbi:helix-turn-helix domain-containing protein [Paenibacillus sp. TAB 01]|uniref:AraC family transcriptional regulator n=1 Tax=Paenibacillus sp. TAB 01 TaxID=3368988 RepID=UPI0037531D38
MNKLLKGTHFFKDPLLSFHIETYTLTEREQIAEHTHDFVEMAYVMDGNAQHHIGGHTYTLRAGDLFFIEPGTLHGYTGPQIGSAVICNVLFDRQLLYREIRSMEPDYPMLELLFLLPFLRKSSVFISHIYISGKERIDLEKHLETLLYEIKRQAPGYPFIIKSRMIECMVGLNRCYTNRSSAVQAELSETQWMEFAVHLIKENYDKPMPLEQISRMCGMSVASFAAKFKGYAGTTFLDFKHNVQIRQACRLLQETSLKAAAVGREVGFEDTGFFYKIFRKKTGMTPIEYRKQTGG